MKDTVQHTPDLQSWVGTTQSTTGYLSAQVAAMAHATLSTDATSVPVAGDVMPALWHWYAFPPTEPMSELGHDGHPQRGLRGDKEGFLPPVPFDRRMWAGGKLTFHAPLRVGEPIERTSTISQITEKSGTAGGMVFVTVDHVLSGAQGVAVRERHDIVYLPIPATYSPPAKKMADLNDVAAMREVEATPPLLFRYSAITFNGHKIHYDRTYAQEVEKYPGLVVHGPLQAQLMMDTACKLRGSAPTMFKFRGMHPMFDDGVMRIIATDDGSTVSLNTVAEAGHIGMSGTATWGAPE